MRIDEYSPRCSGPMGTRKLLRIPFNAIHFFLTEYLVYVRVEEEVSITVKFGSVIRDA